MRLRPFAPLSEMVKGKRDVLWLSSVICSLLLIAANGHLRNPVFQIRKIRDIFFKTVLTHFSRLYELLYVTFANCPFRNRLVKKQKDFKTFLPSLFCV